MVYRRFGYLQSRLLLEKQDELQKLERNLDRLDARDAKEDPDKLNRRDLGEEEAAPRRALFVQIDTKFREYGTLSHCVLRCILTQTSNSFSCRSTACLVQQARYERLQKCH